MKADLHLHTCASDGVLSPEEIVIKAAAEGFDLIAVTDHDTMAGVKRACEEAKKQGIDLITGVEFSCGRQGGVHVLGYGMDPKEPALQQFFGERGGQRARRAERMVEQLCDAGRPIDIARVRELAGGVIGRPHVAQALVEAGHASSVSDAFTRYLVPGKPGYVDKEIVTVTQAVQMILAAHGVPVLAHPMELKKSDMALEALVHEWAQQGLAGIEIYHPSTQNNHIRFLEGLAKREGLLVTGGSDYHGEAVSPHGLGCGLERWRTIEADVQALCAAVYAKKNPVG